MFSHISLVPLVFKSLQLLHTAILYWPCCIWVQILWLNWFWTNKIGGKWWNLAIFILTIGWCVQTGQYSSFSKISSDSDIFPIGRLLYTCWTQNRPQNMKTCMLFLANKIALLAPFYPLGEDYQFHFTLNSHIAPSCAAILLTLGDTCYAYTCMKTTPMHTIQASKHQRQHWKKNISQLFYIIVCYSAPTVNGNMALPRGIGSTAKASEYVCSPFVFIFCHSILLK